MASLTLLAAPALHAAPASATRLGAPYYDARRQEVVLPYTGPLPIWTEGVLRQPDRVYFDIRARSLSTGTRHSSVASHPQLLAWTFASHGETRARLTLVLRKPTEVALRFDARQHLIRFDCSALPAPPLLPPPRVPQVSGLPLRPLPGQREVAPRSEPASLRRVSPVLPARLASPSPPRGDAVASPVLERQLQGVLEGLDTHKKPLPLPSEPGLAYLPGTPDERAPIPPVPLPAPSMAPFPAGPAPWSSPPTFDLHVASAGMLGAFEATVPGFTQAARSDSHGVSGARLFARWGAWEVPGESPAWWTGLLDAYAGGVAFVDPQIADGLQARQGWRLHAAGLRGARVAGLDLHAGLGLALKQDQFWRAVTPVQGGAVSQGTRVMVAPECLLLAAWPLSGGVGLYAEGALAPAWFVADAGAVMEPAPLTGSRLEGGLDWNFAGLRVAIGYRRWSLGGPGYAEASYGPVLTLGGWLAPSWFARERTAPGEPGPKQGTL
ncbi:MAG: hypothetical protein VKP62_14320 [Candidatus Sericytochromatia bacterium]|nr:hypothetical protein [Candidatus Sericytochromatia bacterium]